MPKNKIPNNKMSIQKVSENSDYKKRREDLKQMMGVGSIAILPACPIKIRNRDAEYDYRPDSDFYYLSAFPEPEAVLVLVPGREHGEYILFCRERNPKTTIWTGEVAGQEGAVALYEADDSFPIDDLDDILPGLLEGIERVYYTMGTYPDFDKQLIGWVNGLKNQARSGVHTPGEFISLDHFLHELRLFKSPREQKLMRQAAKISCKAHKKAMQIYLRDPQEIMAHAHDLYDEAKAFGDPINVLRNAIRNLEYLPTLNKYLKVGFEITDLVVKRLLKTAAGYGVANEI